VKINEVEALVGITRKNIRFYEGEGLLTPRRNSENGYRDYGEAEVAVLRRIKLMRKLGVPLEEIRKMQGGVHTVGDGMRRHMVTLERDLENLEQAIRLCGGLTDCPQRLEDLDAQDLLIKMETLEQEGTTFQNKQRSDIRIRYVAPLAIAGSMTALMAGLMGLLVWVFLQNPVNGLPLPLLLISLALLALVTGGVLAALFQRLREIGKGEIDDAKNY
jgi:DNA-binding transcriptional MerR regulator